MRSRLNWAVALYILSFFLPVLSLEHDPEQTMAGWQIAKEIVLPEGDIFSTGNWEIIGYILANFTNPLVLLVIILKYAKKGSAKAIYVLSTIAVFSALIWIPFFFSTLFIDFQMGYWLWLISIFLIHFYVNDSSFKRPSKRNVTPDLK